MVSRPLDPDEVGFELDFPVLGALDWPADPDELPPVELPPDGLQPARRNPATTRASPAMGRLDRFMRSTYLGSSDCHVVARAIVNLIPLAAIAGCRSTVIFFSGGIKGHLRGLQRPAPPPQQHRWPDDAVGGPAANSIDGPEMLRERHQVATDVPGLGARTTTTSHRCYKRRRSAGNAPDAGRPRPAPPSCDGELAQRGGLRLRATMGTLEDGRLG